MKTIAVIPARMGSSRFPGKPIAQILGRPMIEHIYKRVAMSKSVDATYIATCDEEIRDDVYEKIDYFLANGFDSFYVEEHRQRFLKEMLDYPDANVLPRYVSLLEQLSS